MENASIWRVKKSLGFSLGLIWSIGVPNIGVLFIRRLVYTMILSLLFFALWGISLPGIIQATFAGTVPDIGILSLTSIITCTFNYVTMIVWVTRGARILQETIVEISKVDLVIRDFKIVKKNLSLRWNQILSIGLFLLYCSIDLTSNCIYRDILHKTMSAADIVPLSQNLVYWSCTKLSYLQLLTIDILFSSVMSVIRYRFQLVNMILYKIGNIVLPKENFVFGTNRREKYIVSRNNRAQTTEFQVKQIASELDLLWEIHKHLREITENFSSVFSVVLLFEFLTELTLSLNHAFSITAIFLGKSSSQYIVIFIRTMTLLYNIMRTWMLVKSCTAVVTEANKFGLMLHRINVAGLDFYQKLRELSIKHHQERLEIIACGFLPVDNSWLTNIFFMVTAYAVLITQLR